MSTVKKTPQDRFRLPDHFRFGATLCAYSVEGGNTHADWAHWEQRPGRIADGATAHPAANHAEIWREDLNIAQRLGLDTLLMNLEWSRICPAGPAAASTALDHYASVLEGLAARGIRPMLALQHTSLPEWLARSGGWAAPGAGDAAAAYIDAVARRLGPLAPDWLLAIEPQHALMTTHAAGLGPTTATGWRALRRAETQWAAAHCWLDDALQRYAPDARLGYSVRTGSYAPLSAYSVWDLRAAERLHAMRERRLGETVLEAGGRIDFVLASYDGLRTAGFHPRALATHGAASLDARGRRQAPGVFAPAPDALAEALAYTGRWGVPVYFAGHHTPPADDTDRLHTMLDSLVTLSEAARQGAPLAGYLHRALLDGFEWSAGYTQRFGLVHVDFATQARTPNPSAFALRDIVAARGITPGVLRRYAPDWRAGRAARVAA